MAMRSLKKNVIYSIINTGSSLVFPLISFQYAARILMPENIGKVNYANSIVSYFSLFAALGISTYAVREGARIRDDAARIKNLASELVSINIISTILSYGALLVFVILIPELHPYSTTIGVLSLSIVFNTIGVNWLNIIYEDYRFITIRNVLMQVIAFVVLLLLVHRK